LLDSATFWPQFAHGVVVETFPRKRAQTPTDWHPWTVQSTAAVLVMTVLLSGAPACGSHVPHTAKAVCSEAVPHWQTASATRVRFIRHFRTSGLQKLSPFARVFGAVPDRALAAWCWTSPRPRTYHAYAVTHGQKPILIASYYNQRGRTPKGRPVII
jgi:hypothetical protein